MDQRVVRERFDHKQREVDAASLVALKVWIDVAAPDWRTLALAFFEVSPGRDRPLRGR